MSAERERLRRALAIAGIVLAGIAIAGIVLARSLLYLWVFLLVFGLAPLPARGYQSWRGRRRIRPRGESRACQSSASAVSPATSAVPAATLGRPKMRR